VKQLLPLFYNLVIVMLCHQEQSAIKTFFKPVLLHIMQKSFRFNVC